MKSKIIVYVGQFNINHDLLQSYKKIGVLYNFLINIFITKNAYYYISSTRRKFDQLEPVRQRI